MIKRIIFDFDNTLVKWIDEYDYAIKDILKKYNINADYREVTKVIDEYDSVSKYYNTNDLLEYLNNKLHLDLSLEIIEDWLNELGTKSYASDELIDLLDYLSKKYELVILTSWYSVSQIARMKHANIYKYFIDVIGGDIIKKPNKDAFIKAMGDKKIDECIMIGDVYDIDIKPALELGMKTIMVSDKVNENTDTIDDIIKLKEML